MNYFHDAIALHNECVRQLLANDDDKAKSNDAPSDTSSGTGNKATAETLINTLQWAVASLQCFSDRVERNSFPSEQDRCNTSFCFDQQPSSSSATVEPQHNGLFYVYETPLQLPTVRIEDLIRTEAWDSLVFMVSTSVLFNVALVYHRHALQNVGVGTSTSRLLYAGQLYDMVLSILHTVQGSHESHRVLKCLALNNRAHILYECCDYANSMMCLDEMCDLLSDKSSNNGADGVTGSAVHNDYVLEQHIHAEQAAKVKRNIIYLQPPTAASSA